MAKLQSAWKQLVPDLKDVAKDSVKELIKPFLTLLSGTLLLFAGRYSPIIGGWLKIPVSLPLFGWLICLVASFWVGFALRLILSLKRIRELEILARTDELTSLMNPRAIDEYLEHEFQRASQKNLPLSLIIIDIDEFKQVNEKAGYSSGDLVLKQFAQLLLSDRRSSDLLFRYKSGDEFLILAPDTPGTGARMFAERLRKNVKDLTFQLVGQQPNIQITMSAGVTEAKLPGDTLRSFLDRAEEILKKAKEEKNMALLG
jgi:diguanylate cyclase (GGDEF)-like protein